MILPSIYSVLYAYSGTMSIYFFNIIYTWEQMRTNRERLKPLKTHGFFGSVPDVPGVPGFLDSYTRGKFKYKKIFLYIYSM